MSFKRIVEKETKQKNDNYLDLTIFKMLPMKKFSKTTNQRKKKNPKLKNLNRLIRHWQYSYYNKNL